jgi:hypothetical protein
MNDEGIEWAIRELLLLRDRVAALEAAQPKPLTFPAIEPSRLPSVQAAERLGYAPFGYEERS